MAERKSKEHFVEVFAHELKKGDFVLVKRIGAQRTDWREVWQSAKPVDMRPADPADSWEVQITDDNLSERIPCVRDTVFKKYQKPIIPKWEPA